MRKLTLTVVGADDDAVYEELSTIAEVGLPLPSAPGADDFGETEHTSGVRVAWRWETVSTRP